MQSIEYDQTVECTFHNVDYILRGHVDGKVELVIEAEQKSNGARWFGQFSPQSLEQLTRKTGNFKRFPVFVKMLSTALSRTSESVFVELFTYADLEALQQKRAGRSAAPSRASKVRSSNKRYLILTYIVEFDK